MDIEQEYIKNVENLPPCPDIALEVLTLAQDLDCNFRELARKIERDPNLTANMLRMANSVYFGYMKQISSVRDMIVRLGLDNIKLIAITGASVAFLKPSKMSYGLKTGALWQHSYATAVLSSIIGRYARVEKNNTLYTAALLHDVGKVVLDRPLEVEISSQEQPPDHIISFVDFEAFLLRTNHAKVGMALLESWGLPEDIYLPVGNHHLNKHEGSAGLYSKIVYLANFLIERMGLLLTDPVNYNFDLQETEDIKAIMEEIPGFESNKKLIFDEFFLKFSDGLAIL